MSGNVFGKYLTMTSFGESHGSALGVVVDGIPANLAVDLKELQIWLDRRSPGQPGTTARVEGDLAEILSGVFEGKTLGTPVCVIVKNMAQQSKDYNKLKGTFRVGHADKTTIDKYGIRDHRGGGRSSGRETLARVVGGYFASLIVPSISVAASIANMGNMSHVVYPLEDSAIEYLNDLKQQGESVGGRVKLTITNCPASLGEPVFDKLKADLAKAIMSIGAVTSFSYGIGEDFAQKKGSECSLHPEYFGGIEGGISNGSDLVVSFCVKPTSTTGDSAKQGRHDPCIIPRLIPVAQAMVLFTIADHYLRQKIYE